MFGSSNDETKNVTSGDSRMKSHLFRHKRKEKNGADDDATEVDAPVSKGIAPVSFTKLFRCAEVD
jgi:hypothetical protein